MSAYELIGAIVSPGQVTASYHAPLSGLVSMRTGDWPSEALTAAAELLDEAARSHGQGREVACLQLYTAVTNPSHLPGRAAGAAIDIAYGHFPSAEIIRLWADASLFTHLGDRRDHLRDLLSSLAPTGVAVP